MTGDGLATDADIEEADCLDGARQGLENMLGLKPGERVLVVTDNQTSANTRGAFVRVAEEVSGIKPTVYNLDEYGVRPLTKTPEGLAEAAQNAQVTLFVAQSIGEELDTVRRPFIKTATGAGARHGHCPGFTLDMMRQGMCADYQVVYALSNALYQFLSTKRRINITSESGGLGVKTNLIIETDARRFPWIPSGPVQPGEMANLPDGEVFCYPLNVNGTAVIDGCVGDYMAKKYGSIAKTPLVISFSNNEIRNVSCPGNPELEKDFRNYVFNLDGRREFLTRFVGELAFGTNTGVEALIGNMLQDEKCWKAIHIAAADPLDHDGSGAGYTCKGHIDCLMMSPTAVVDGITLMKDGNYSREILLDALKHLPDKYSLERSSGGIYTLKAA